VQSRGTGVAEQKYSNKCNNSVINKKKSELHVRISSEVIENLRSLIMQKYTRMERGLLSHEVEMALRHWLALHTNTQSSEKQIFQDPIPKVTLVFMQVKEYLLKKYYEELPPEKEIYIKNLEEAIAYVRGSDKRTIRKWLETFSRMKLIKHVSGTVLGIL